MRMFGGMRVKSSLVLILIVVLIGGSVTLWPDSRLWHPIAACGQLLSAVAVFFLTLNFIIENKRENFRDIEAAILHSDKLQGLMDQWEDALAKDPAASDKSLVAKLAGRIQDEIVRYSILIESGALSLELVEKYTYLNRDFVNLFLRFDVSHGQYGVRLSPDWEIARPIVAKIIDSRQRNYAKG